MTQPFLPPPPDRGESLPTVYPPDVALYHAPDGTTYVTQRSPTGQVTFTPVSAIAPPSISVQPVPLPPQTVAPRGRDPLVTLLMILGGVVGLIGLAWLVGFLAGRSGQQTVYYPREPICDTRSSEFLFWSRYEKECH